MKPLQESGNDITVIYRDRTGAKREEAIEAARSATITPLSLAVFKATLVKM